MRCLLRNKKRFYYCRYLWKTEGSDSSGNHTGEYEAKYGNAILSEGNISEASGSNNNEVFGISIHYNRVIVIDDPNFAMDEDDVLFVDKEPEYDGTGFPIFDYIVKGVSRSLNSVSYAIQKVTIS